MTFHPEEGDMAAYLDRELRWRTRWKLRAHLLCCAQCRDVLAELAEGLRYFDQLRPQAYEGALESIRENLIQSLSEEAPRPAQRVLLDPAAVREIAVFLGSRVAAAFGERIASPADISTAFAPVAEVLDTLVGQHAAETIRHRLVREIPK